MKIKLRLSAFILLCLVAGNARAQGPVLTPSYRPAFSPWLNLNRQGNSAALNYYGLVRPQFTVNNSIYQLQQQTGALQQEQQQPATTVAELPPTGHASGFLNHTKYFLNRGGATPLSGQRGLATAAPQLARPKTRH